MALKARKSQLFADVMEGDDPFRRGADGRGPGRAVHRLGRPRAAGRSAGGRERSGGGRGAVTKRVAARLRSQRPSCLPLPSTTVLVAVVVPAENDGHQDEDTAGYLFPSSAPPGPTRSGHAEDRRQRQGAEHRVGHITASGPRHGDGRTRSKQTQTTTSACPRVNRSSRAESFRRGRRPAIRSSWPVRDRCGHRRCRVRNQ